MGGFKSKSEDGKCDRTHRKPKGKQFAFFDSPILKICLDECLETLGTEIKQFLTILLFLLFG